MRDFIVEAYKVILNILAFLIFIGGNLLSLIAIINGDIVDYENPRGLLLLYVFIGNIGLIMIFGALYTFIDINQNLKKLVDKK